MIRIAHFSDLHFSEKNLDEADRCFGFAIDEAIRRQAQVAVISGDSTDHALDVHSPAVERLARQVCRLADHCPVLMLQGTFSHEPPGTLAIFRLLGGRFKVHVADRIAQVALLPGGEWFQSEGWRFDAVPCDAQAIITCVPTVNKAVVAASVGPADAGVALGQELARLLAGYTGIHQAARKALVPTIGVSHGTVTGCQTEHGVPMAGFDHEFTTGSLFAAQAQAFMLGHIHKHQHWEDAGRVVAYAGSIGRFHYGEQGDKGFVLWEVGASVTRFELVPTPSRRTVEQALASLLELQRLCRSGESMPLREASARAFRGRSKVLDARDELLRLFGAQPGQFFEPPIQLLVDVPLQFDEALFVENLVTFERMADRRQPAWSRSLLLYAAGFKGSARRLRSRQGCRIYLRAPNDVGATDGLSGNGGLHVVAAWLFDGADLPVRFFGDLDFAGLQILANLREVFGETLAWQPGYEKLAAALLAGEGHAPVAAAKDGQSDPGRTGCEYADRVLLPLLRKHPRFIDQEHCAVWA